MANGSGKNPFGIVPSSSGGSFFGGSGSGGIGIGGVASSTFGAFGPGMPPEKLSTTMPSPKKSPGNNPFSTKTPTHNPFMTVVDNETDLWNAMSTTKTRDADFNASHYFNKAENFESYRMDGKAYFSHANKSSSKDKEDDLNANGNGYSSTFMLPVLPTSVDSSNTITPATTDASNSINKTTGTEAWPACGTGD